MAGALVEAANGSLSAGAGNADAENGSWLAEVPPPSDTLDIDAEKGSLSFALAMTGTALLGAVTTTGADDAENGSFIAIDMSAGAVLGPPKMSSIELEAEAGAAVAGADEEKGSFALALLSMELMDGEFPEEAPPKSSSKRDPPLDTLDTLEEAEAAEPVEEPL